MKEFKIKNRTWKLDVDASSHDCIVMKSGQYLVTSRMNPDYAKFPDAVRKAEELLMKEREIELFND